MKVNSFSSSSSDEADTCCITCQNNFSAVDTETMGNDDNYQETLRRILKKSDPRTKEHLRACLSEDLLSWLRLYPSRVEACTCENDEYLVQALESIYRATGHHKLLENDTIDDTLLYVQASLSGLLIDTLRFRSTSYDVSMPRLKM